MARKITRLSLEELEKEIPAIPQSEQEKCLGGYKGSEYSPYSREEYLRSLASGSWEGGFVSMTEVEIAEYRNNTSQGLMYSAWTPNTIYIERHIVLDEFTVTAPAPTGSYDDEAFQRMRERYGIYDGSGFWGVVDPITGFSDAYEGGGSSIGTNNPSNSGSDNSWSELSKELRKYNIILSGSADTTEGENLKTILNALLGSKGFITLLGRLKTHGTEVKIHAEILPPKVKGGGYIYNLWSDRLREERV